MLHVTGMSRTAPAKAADLCRLCPRQCAVDRARAETGFCGVGATPRYFADFVHFGEESCLIPSYTIFFTGCNLRCAFCSSRDYVDNPALGAPVDPRYFRRQITAHAREGARTVNLLGGEPACNLPAIAEIFAGYDSPIPVVWNSNLYFSPDCFPLILPFTNIFLADFKFGNDSCAARLASAPGYTNVVTSNLLAAAAERTTIVRHLLLPGHFDCCAVPVLDWIAESLPGVAVSILGSFVPRPHTCGPAELRRTLDPAEVTRAVSFARARGLRLVH